MVSRWVRIGYSVIALAVGIVCCTTGIAVNTAVLSGRWTFSVLLFFVPFVMISSLPGWLLALPLVLIISRVSGVRFWLFLAAGTAIGPALICFESVWRWASGGKVEALNHDAIVILAIATGVAFITTLVYLWLLRCAQRRVVA